MDNFQQEIDRIKRELDQLRILPLPPPKLNDNRVKLINRQRPSFVRSIGKTVVQHDNRALAEKRGWRTRDGRLEGYYRTQYGAWLGRIQRRGDIYVVTVRTPPIDRIRSHRKWPCFQDLGEGWWRVHLRQNPRDGDLSSVIDYVEGLIVESFEGKGGWR